MGKVELAEMIATIMHAGQKDKGGNSYIEHPRVVASKMHTEDEIIVAWLHDVVEDTEISLEDLRNFGFSDTVINAVEAITKKENESRVEYLKRLSKNDIAVKVKIADLKHNSDITRIPNPTISDIIRSQRYKNEIKWLEVNGKDENKSDRQFR